MARICVTVVVGSRNFVGMGTVAVAVKVAAKGPGRTIRSRLPQRLRNKNRLRQPITAVPARLEFDNLLMAFIPYILCYIDFALCAI